MNICIQILELITKKSGGWMNGWVDGCEGAKASLWIAYSNYKYLGYWLILNLDLVKNTLNLCFWYPMTCYNSLKMLN